MRERSATKQPRAKATELANNNDKVLRTRNRENRSFLLLFSPNFKRLHNGFSQTITMPPLYLVCSNFNNKLFGQKLSTNERECAIYYPLCTLYTLALLDCVPKRKAATRRRSCQEALLQTSSWLVVGCSSFTRSLAASWLIQSRSHQLTKEPVRECSLATRGPN